MLTAKELDPTQSYGVIVSETGLKTEAAPPSRTATAFDYESKRWGAARIAPRPWFMNGLKLCYLLSDLIPVHGRVLDVGCGAGSIAKAVKRARPDLEVFGCDLSSSALTAAAAPSAEGVDFRLATAERLPFADGELDFVSEVLGASVHGIGSTVRKKMAFLDAFDSS